jgi:WD40 repeat protein
MCSPARAFAPDGQVLAAVSQDDLLWLWRVADRHLLRSTATQTGGENAVVYTPDGHLLVTAAPRPAIPASRRGYAR